MITVPPKKVENWALPDMPGKIILLSCHFAIISNFLFISNTLQLSIMNSMLINCLLENVSNIMSHSPVLVFNENIDYH